MLNKRGYNIVLKLNSKLAAGTTENSFKITPTLEETLIKDDAGQKQYEHTGYESELSISGLMRLNEEGETTQMDAKELRAAAKAGTIIPFVYGGKDSGDDTEEGALIISDYSEDSNSSDIATYSVSCKVVGSLTAGTVA